MTFPRRLPDLVVLATLLAVPACAAGGGATPGGTGSSQAQPTASPTASAVSSPTPPSEAFPVRIEQSLGDVTIPRAPARVVALDFPSADAALALGVVPVAMARLSYIEGGVQTWTREALRGATPELIETDQGFPFEALARLDPDLIVATNTYPLVKDSWTRLTAIAPVVGHVKEAGLDGWQDGMRKVARALGRRAEGERLIEAAETAVREARTRNPGFAGKTVNFFNYVADGGLYAISSNDDVSMRFMRDLGFAGAPSSVTALNSAGGPAEAARATISPERYDVLEADVILGTSSDATPGMLDRLRADELFARVPAVARGSFLGIGIGPATAMAFPSVLSVPYAVRELVPQLAAAEAR